MIKKFIKRVMDLMSSLFSLTFTGSLILFALFAFVILSYGGLLPDYRRLDDYEPPVTSRFYAGDGRLLAEYATEKRVFIPIASIPERVKRAFISAEDKKFYTHSGLDFFGIVRAAITNVRNAALRRRPVGASTITQQVAKNILLSSERSFVRKVKEAITATRIERTFTKDRILELYLNEIYLGYGSYGVAMAAQNYFDKALNELTLSEAAYLAALPKAPSNYDPARHYDAAVARRNWVLKRMLDDGAIDKEQYEAAKAEPIKVAKRPEAEVVANGDYFAEEVRRDIVNRYGSDSIYLGGLTVRTSLNPALQKAAAKALMRGIEAYDRKYGWRGPLKTIDISGEDQKGKPAWLAALKAADIGAVPAPWQPAVVLSVSDESARIGTLRGEEGEIGLANLKWARRALPKYNLGPEVGKAGDVLKTGDVVAVEKDNDGWQLKQIPALQGAIVAVDPHTGRVLAMHGGFSFATSEYNRATQSKRQPGSVFKPFVYLTALENGYLPTSLILDAPFVYDQGVGLPKWKPENYTSTFYGPTTMRVGLERSRNLMTVRLANAVGMDKVKANAEKLGIYDDMPPLLAMSLGAGDTTLLRLVTAYSVMLNGGMKIAPTFIDRIQDKTGKTVYRSETRDCLACGDGLQLPPNLPDARERLLDPIPAYQIINILNGVVNSGTGSLARIPGVTLAGKTGTSNNNADAWFVGMTADLVVGIFLGYDEPKSLGRNQTGGVIAAPIFRDFMVDALKEVEALPFRRPKGIKLARVNHKTGRPAAPADRDVVLEAFPSAQAQISSAGVIDGSEVYGDPAPGGEDSAVENPKPATSEDITDEGDSLSTGGIY